MIKACIDVTKVICVAVDDTILDSQYYDLVEVSPFIVNIVFHKNYLNSLPAGEHTYKVETNDGDIEGYIKINNHSFIVPNTGVSK